MRVETNVRVIKRNRQIAQSTFFLSMAIWLAGLGITLLPLFTERDPTEIGWIEIVPTIILPIGLGIALFAVHMTNLWIREPRPEQAIRDGLKGISKQSVLYHYHHNPAKHVLIAPQGIFVMIIRFQSGKITVDGERWQLQRSFIARLAGVFRLEGLGSPNDEAERAVSYLQRILEPIAPDVEIQALIVLTDPRAEAAINESPIPVLYADEKQKPNLKNFMRKHPNKSADLPLTPEQLQAFEEATLPVYETDDED